MQKPWVWPVLRLTACDPRRLRWLRGSVLIAVVLGVTVAACDSTPSLEDQLRDIGVAPDAVYQVDAATILTIRDHDGKPELVFFKDIPSGWSQDAVPAVMETTNGGEAGWWARNDSSYYTASPTETWGYQEPWFCYVFGAGQGPVASIRVNGHEAEWLIVNPAIDGWLLVERSPPVVLTDLDWELVSPDGSVLFAAHGIEDAQFSARGGGCWSPGFQVDP